MVNMLNVLTLWNSTLTFFNVDFNRAPLPASWGDATNGKGPNCWDTSMEVQYLLWTCRINKEDKLFIIYVINFAIKTRSLFHLVQCIYVHTLCSIFCRTFVLESILASCNITYQTIPWSICCRTFVLETIIVVQQYNISNITMTNIC